MRPRINECFTAILRTLALHSHHPGFSASTALLPSLDALLLPIDLYNDDTKTKVYENGAGRGPLPKWRGFDFRWSTKDRTNVTPAPGHRETYAHILTGRSNGSLDWISWIGLDTTNRVLSAMPWAVLKPNDG